MPRFTSRIGIEADPKEVFTWHAMPGSLERLMPPWEKMRVAHRSGDFGKGLEVTLDIRRGLFATKWIAEITKVIEGEYFQDVQKQGILKSWTHNHRFTEEDRNFCMMEDDIEYELPLGGAGRALAGSWADNSLARLFRFRHDRTRNDIFRHLRYRRYGQKRVAVSGASGMIGSALVNFLRGGGHTVLPMVRKPAPDGSGEVYWNYQKGEIDAGALEGVDAVIHLAGDNIGSAKWTEAKKQSILASRVDGTKFLCESLAKLKNPPALLISASAVGYYGNRGDEELTEDSAPGEGFLPDVVRRWEDATSPASDAGIRVVTPRFGVVMTAGGGALERMLTPFKMGFGGKLGDGRQYVSWIALEDLVSVFYFLLMKDKKLSGPVNAVSPNPVANAEMTRILGRLVNRPTLATMPAGVVRAIFGEMGQALLLDGARVAPERLLDAGFQFMDYDLNMALCRDLGLIQGF